VGGKKGNSKKDSWREMIMGGKKFPKTHASSPEPLIKCSIEEKLVYSMWLTTSNSF
jgi:hypothetical protein